MLFGIVSGVSTIPVRRAKSALFIAIGAVLLGMNTGCSKSIVGIGSFTGTWQGLIYLCHGIPGDCDDTSIAGQVVLSVTGNENLTGEGAISWSANLGGYQVEYALALSGRVHPNGALSGSITWMSISPHIDADTKGSLTISGALDPVGNTGTGSLTIHAIRYLWVVERTASDVDRPAELQPR